MERINAGLLIPGRGEPVREAAVLIDGGRISYAGPAAGAPESPGAVTHRAATVLPGLWDCHGHFNGTRSMNLARLAQEPVQLRAARAGSRRSGLADARSRAIRDSNSLGWGLGERRRWLVCLIACLHWDSPTCSS